MNRTDIVGLTLAEIALVLLFSFVALLVPAYARLNRKLKQLAPVDVAKLQSDLQTAKAANQKLTAELELSRHNLRSAAIPSCAELDKADWLFTAIIRGADTYEVNGNTFSINTLLQNYSRQLADATKSGCRHRVKLYYGREVSLPDYDYAMRKIEQYFYDLKLGPES